MQNQSAKKNGNKTWKKFLTWCIRTNGFDKIISFLANSIYIWCDHRASTSTANHPKIHPWKCDCNKANIIYCIFYQNQCDFVSHLSSVMFKVKTKFGY